MKKLLLTTALVLTSFSAIADENFSKIENNIRVESGAVGLNAKLNFNDATRELGLDYTVLGFTLGYTRAEGATDVLDENRFIAAYAVSYSYVYGRLAVEYRDFEEGDDYFRILPTLGAQYPLDNKVTSYAEVTPKLSYGKSNSADFTSITDVDYKIGADYAFTESVKAGPFIQLNTDSSFDKNEVFLGTGITVKF